MWCRPRWLVQSTEDGSFLAADGEGGVTTVQLFGSADAFDEPESAVEALADHLDGHGVIIQVFSPAEKNEIQH
jgi:hypothetical protein